MDTQALTKILNAILEDHDARSKQVADYRQRIINLVISSLIFQVVSASFSISLAKGGDWNSAAELARGSIIDNEEIYRMVAEGMGLKDVLHEVEIKQICEDKLPYFLNRLLSILERGATSGNSDEKKMSNLLDPEKGIGFAP